MYLLQRRRQPELMDQPDLDACQHVHALRGLERINRYSGSSRILWPPLKHLAQRQPGRLIRVLDVATGGGDVPIRLWQQARRAGVRLSVEACDISTHAIDHARQRAAAQAADVRFFALDVLREPLPSGYDVITCSLFLHHLDNHEARDLLRRMADAAGRSVLVNDLRRGGAGYFLAYVGTRVLSSSHVVHVDGPRSVEAAFTIAEVRQLAFDAGLAGATVARRWPCRFLLTWQRL